jgi:nitrous oxidase accessory protein
VVDGNWMIANTLGTYLDRTPRSSLTSARFERNLFSLNATAMRLHSSEEGLEFSGNTLLNNRETVEVEGGGDALGTRFVGNYWSDYAGYDLDRDGTGDVAHEVQRLSSSLFQEHPTLSLFDGGLSVGLVDVIARALPVFATDRLLVDEKPRFSARGGERDPH